MRTKGTIYDPIARLPANALPVSVFAAQQGIQVAQVYTKYKRYLHGYPNGTHSAHPGYDIRQWNGSNYVVPCKTGGTKKINH